eukprot:m.8056 g.8056  ORF g.8056 m.8056 type:complete len:59 (+) comp2819_c0_seq2:152-328(+)
MSDIFTFLGLEALEAIESTVLFFIAWPVRLLCPHRRWHLTQTQKRATCTRRENFLLTD